MKSKIKDCLLIIVILGLFVLIWFLADSKELESEVTIDDDTYGFITNLDDFIANLDDNMDLTDAKTSIASQMTDLSKYYSDGDLVGYASQDILNLLRDKNITSTEQLKTELDSELDRISNDYGSLVDSKDIKPRELSMNSNTVCSVYGSSSEYCLADSNNNLKGYVYISSSSSKKWVVLLHGNAGSGKIIYNQIGAMYVAKGYNILAPDLRGSGKSGGVNSWSYLESLDTYDWIKWLNENYSVDTLVIHGVSLGANIGMQLITNPNYADVLRNQYHFKGIVEDSGYVSLTELVKGLINAGDTMDLNLFIENTEEESGNFEKNIISVINELGITADQKTINDLANGNISTDEFERLINGYINNRQVLDNSATINRQRYNNGSYDVVKLADANEAVTDDIIKQYIIENKVFGINESNFDMYENVFANGRNFRSSDKVLIIHSRTDDIIHYRNAVEVNSKAGSANTRFRFYWNVQNQPHAFILAGIQKESYTNLVQQYLRCVENDSYCADGNFSNYVNS